jgi:hypothetical protein
MSTSDSVFSAAEQGLGYIFQSRFALLKALDLPEDEFIYIERNDDVEFVTTDKGLALGSLKHKAVGERSTDLSTDFWKSVIVWLSYYKKSGMISSNAHFMLFSTASISAGSFLSKFVDVGADDVERAIAAAQVLERSQAKITSKVKSELSSLSGNEVEDFYGRITIFPDTLRINEIPGLIDKQLRTVRREYRQALFERLAGR